MSCFGGAATAAYSSSWSTSSSAGVTRRGCGSSRRPWRWWRAKCAGVAASVGSRLRRSIEGLDGRRRRRRRRATSSSVTHHRRRYPSFAPAVYVDELYAHHQQTSSEPLSKLNAADDAARAGGKPRAAAAAGGGGGAMKNVLTRSPGRGGGGVLGVVKGMGEVDLRAELFIRKFKEDMRLQSQRSAEEVQAMLARGL